MGVNPLYKDDERWMREALRAAAPAVAHVADCEMRRPGIIGTVAFCLAMAGLTPVLSAARETVLPPVTFYVAAGGDDAWSGRLAEPNAARTDGPFACVSRAQKAVRLCREEGRLPAPVTVRIRGLHRLKAPLVFTPPDSGSAKCPVTYTSYPGERAVLSGGRVIAGWRKGPGGVWTARVPEAKTGAWRFRQLFVAGKRARRARSPNHGYFHVPRLIGDTPKTPWNKGVDGFHFNPGDIKPWPDLQDVEVIVYHSWNTSRVRIASVDETNRIVTFTGPTIFRPLAWDPDQRYTVENAADLLDEPGEWYLDRRTGTVSYWPHAGEDMTKAEVVAPHLTELVRFQGDPDKGRLVDHVRVVGLSFQHADWTLGEKGYGDPQAAVSIGAVVSAEGARHCVVEGCEIAHVGTYGVWFGRGSKDCRIAGNDIHDLGAGGVRIGSARMAKTDAAEAGRNLVHNNYIHDGGHVYPAGVGLWLAQSSHNVVSHNEIHSFNYSGMSVGWNWNEAPNRTHHNLIEYNHVHHVVRGVLSDAGGIYTLGTQTGTVIRNNVFHDIWPYMGKPAMAWGIYFDQGSNGMLVENNVVYHTLTGGIMNTGHPANVVRNNVFALSAQTAAWRYTWIREPSTRFERNIIYLTQGDLFHNDGGRSDTKSVWDHNCFWRADGKELLFYGETFEDWQAKGMDRHSIVADPKFVDAGRFNFGLRPDSPALGLGIEPIDTSTVGLVGQPQWVNLPKRCTFPPTVLPPPPPPPTPVPVDDGFERTPVGARPALAQVFEEGKGDAVRVTDETAAGGKRSLKVTDAAGLKHVWNPHLFYQPHMRRGKVTLGFDIRLEPGADVAHEWRDAAQPYRVGPTLRIGPDGQLAAGGKPLATVPIGKWFRIEIGCALGKGSGATYDLTLTLPGEGPRAFKRLPFRSPKFTRLEWLGFISLADAETAFAIDNVTLTPAR